ncbi:uncharacterized protein K02A2.6-like [Toxorhynchites rutilus septentrionalis]|uniref:uncharacterized protein K02A2.6-like n=1 Tax=Toxorhynchites rutilus septentrionalis TaxID=329112 RepID=UPI002478BABE|nr:uncharacterized protein K02A2.6-like [Toxorhynchites rutilus septentrionalis]
MADADLKQAILRLTDLIANQQQQIAALQQGNANQVGSEKIIESLSTGIDEFQYDPDGGIFFDSWYARYEDVFEEDGKHLDDKAKVRLLLRKIGTQFHERYVNSVLPSHPRDFSFEDTVKKLKKLFGCQKSLFNARYQCLQYVKNEVDDFSSYSASVNKHCEAFQIGKLSSDQFKTLRFVCGLQSPRDSDIRTRLIGKLEAEENAPPADGANLKLENLVEECNRIINLKQDTQMIEKGCTDKSKVNAISRHRTSNGKEKKSPKTPCWFCGDLHYVKECPYQTHTCSKCKRKGHKEGYCSSSEKKLTKQIDKPKPKDIVKSKGIAVKRVDLKAKRKFVKIDINGVPAKLQLDCASDITIISKRTWTSVGKPVIETTDVAAVSASGDGIDIVGEFNAEITIQDVTKVGRIFVTSNPDLNVLGIETIDQFDLWSVPFSSLVNSIQQNSNATMQKLQAKFPEVFQPTLGCCTKAKVTLYPKPDARPVYCPKRPVAYAALPKVDAELQRLQDNGIISPVQFSDWAAPIVVVRKSDVSVRICGDYSTGLNNALESDRHPLPHPDDMFGELAGCRFFSCIDFSDAYLQVEVEEASRKLLTINTHKGLFLYNRLPPGVKSAPGAFQRIIDSMLAGIPGVKPYLDDILIAGKTQEEHDRSLNDVLQRIRECGFYLRIEKCRFALPQIKFLGHILDKDGLRPDPTKTRAIFEMSAPTNLSQLRSYLGAINYYGRFVGQMKELRAPLDCLLKKLVEGEKAVMFQDLQTFLSVYRSTPNRRIDGKTPAHLFLGRPLRTTLDLLKPCPPSPTLVNEKQNSQFNRRHCAMKRTFDAEEMVFAQVHYRNTTEWVPGQIIERKGNVNYTMLLENGRLIRAHTNQIRQRYGSDADADSTPQNQLPLALLIDEFNFQDMKPPDPVVPPIEDEQPIPDDEPMPVDDEQEVVEDDVNDDESDVPIEDSPQPVRPEGRLRRLPAWLAPYDIF